MKTFHLKYLLTLADRRLKVLNARRVYAPEFRVNRHELKKLGIVTSELTKIIVSRKKHAA